MSLLDCYFFRLRGIRAPDILLALEDDSLSKCKIGSVRILILRVIVRWLAILEL